MRLKNVQLLAWWRVNISSRAFRYLSLPVVTWWSLKSIESYVCQTYFKQIVKHYEQQIYFALHFIYKTVTISAANLLMMYMYIRYYILAIYIYTNFILFIIVIIKFVDQDIIKRHHWIFILFYIYIYIVFLLIVQLIPLHNIAAFINICRILNQCC